MTEERIAKLEKVGFEWSLVAKQAPPLSWDGRYVSSLELDDQDIRLAHVTLLISFLVLQAELLAYRQQHGNCNVPKRYTENIALGNWINYQRREYKKYKRGSKSYMTEERIAKLEKVGFAWSLANRHLSWDDRYVSCLERERDNQLNSYSHHSLTLFLSSRLNYSPTVNSTVTATCQTSMRRTQPWEVGARLNDVRTRNIERGTNAP